MTEMLASWNDGPARRAVVEFVQETVPAGVPTAEDPGPPPARTLAPGGQAASAPPTLTA